MDSDGDEAANLALVFRIGPTSVAGRALALRVIFCKNLRRVLIIVRGVLSARLAAVERWSLYSVRRLGHWVDPRSPHFVLAAVLCAAVLLRRQRLRSAKEVAAYQSRFWNNLMRTALTYDEWAYAASMVEKHQQSNRRKDDELYDEDLVRAKLEDLKQRRLQGDVDEIVFALRTDLLRNLGNMCNPELHKGRLQTPVLIQEYITEVKYHLRAVCDADSHELPLEEKMAFIHETRHAFGRTALMLSGGAALGAFHLGVVRTLIEHRLLPRVLSGASVGSIICSFAATRTWTELQQFFDDPMPPMAFFESMGSIFATAHRLLTKGAIAEIGQLQRKMRLLIGDLTFQEAYDLSGRVLGIPVCSVRPNEPHRLLNYLTAPHVVIWSAVTASCAFPGLFEAQELMAKDRRGRLVPYHMPTEGLPEQQKRKWRDGSLESDLPMKELKELFNVNHFIVSQANPHIAPLLRIKEACRTLGGQWGAKFASLVEMEAKHRCQQALTLGWRWGGLAKLFAQEWEGDVTIIMPATLAQFAKIIQNPTPGELRKAVIQGRRCTWERLSAIQATCGIELMLDECVSDLNQRRKAHLQAAKAASRASVCPVHGAADCSPCRDNNSSVHGSTHHGGSKHGPSLSSLPSWRRIPSWNRFARERSWSSLEEDGVGVPSAPGLTTVGVPAEHAPGMVPGSVVEGSTGGGSSRWLQGAGIQSTYLAHPGHSNHGGSGHNGDSDSDSGTEGTILYSVGAHEGSTRGALLRSWTRAGGPLMTSPSCTCMLQLHDASQAQALGSVHGQAPVGSSSSGAALRTSSSAGALSSPGSAGHVVLPGSGSSPGLAGEDLRSERGDKGEGAVSQGGQGRDEQDVEQGVAGLTVAALSQHATNLQQQQQQQAQHGQNRSRHASPSRLGSAHHWEPAGYSPFGQRAPSLSLWSAPAHFLRPLLAPLLPPQPPRPSSRYVQAAAEGLRRENSAHLQVEPALQGSGGAGQMPLGGEGPEAQGRLGEDDELSERRREMEDEQGMLYGLAIESSMHGHRSASLPPGAPLPGPAFSGFHSMGAPAPSSLGHWGPADNEAVLLGSYSSNSLHAPHHQHPGGLGHRGHTSSAPPVSDSAGASRRLQLAGHLSTGVSAGSAQVPASSSRFLLEAQEAETGSQERGAGAPGQVGEGGQAPALALERQQGDEHPKHVHFEKSVTFGATGVSSGDSGPYPMLGGGLEPLSGTSSLRHHLPTLSEGSSHSSLEGSSHLRSTEGFLSPIAPAPLEGDVPLAMSPLPEHPEQASAGADGRGPEGSDAAGGVSSPASVVEGSGSGSEVQAGDVHELGLQTSKGAAGQVQGASFPASARSNVPSAGASAVSGGSASAVGSGTHGPWRDGSRPPSTGQGIGAGPKSVVRQDRKKPWMMS